MAENKNGFKSHIRNFSYKIMKAAIKGIIFYAIYFVVWTFIAPVAEVVPGLQQSIEVFMATYIVLMIIGELTSGTIYQYFFSAAKAMFVILYLILSLNGGMMGMTFENISLLVDLRLFLMVAMILSLLGLAKSVMQAVNFMNQKAELTYI